MNTDVSVDQYTNQEPHQKFIGVATWPIKKFPSTGLFALSLVRRLVDTD